jgi:hypothetical protein
LWGCHRVEKEEIYIHISVGKPLGNRHTEDRIIWKYNAMEDISEMCYEDER